MKGSFLTTAFLIALIGLSPYPATAKKDKKVPTVQFRQYGLDPSLAQPQAKSDIEISLKSVRISDIYQYPDLFSFKIEDFPQLQNAIPPFTSMYPEGPLGKSWENPFSTPDGKVQVLLFWAKIKNGTSHILKMGDARVYLIIEEQEPIPAFSSFNELLRSVDYFEASTNQYLAQQAKGFLGGLVKVNRRLPAGFYRSLVLYHKSSYKLINDLNKEILPGFTYEGMLAFPSAVTTDRSAKVTFFNVITKTDAAGNPVEKTQFEFPMLPQEVSMWYFTTGHFL